VIAPSKRPNGVDSSAWLEYFAGGKGADHFAGAIEAVGRLVVRASCLMEVVKVVLRQRGESDALQAVALMPQGRRAPRRTRQIAMRSILIERSWERPGSSPSSR
jgi:uncharacterized protein with PIN domain